MVTSVLTIGEGRRRRGAGPAIAISLVLHLLILAAIGLVAPQPRFAQTDQTPVQVMLLPSFEHAHTLATKPAPGAARGPISGRASAEPVLPHVHAPHATTAQTLSPSITAPTSPGATSAGRPGASEAPGPLPYSESERGVRAFLRAAVGCENADAGHLSAEERARCAERFAEDARNGQAFSGIDPAKRGAYSVQAAADERKRTLRENLGSSPLIVPCQGQGSNLGLGCLPDSAIGHAKDP